MTAGVIFVSASASAEEINETNSSANIIMVEGNINDNPNQRGFKFPTKIWNLSDGVYGGDHNEETGGMFYPLYGGRYTYSGYKSKLTRVI